MLESALPLLHSLVTCLAGSSSCLTQHWQSGPWQQHSGWLESAWPFASLNLPLQYSSLNTGSLSLCTARQQLSSSFWTCLGSSSSSSLASWSKLFWVSMCCYVLEDEFQKNRGYKFETLPLYVHWQPGRCSCMCQSYDLWLAASLTCSCLAGVTIFFWVLQQYCNAHIAQCCWGLGPVASSLTRAQWRTQQQFEWHSNNQDGTIIMEGLFLLCCCNDVCYEVTIHFCTQKIFFPKVYEKRSLVLTTTSDWLWISCNGHIKDWYKRSSTQKFNWECSTLQIRSHFFCSFWLLSCVPADTCVPAHTNRLIFLQVL